jgi:predicted nucleotidyltransferase
MSILSTYKHQIDELCSRHKVKSLYAFGSVLSSEFNTESDIDLIVEFSNISVAEYADNYYDLKFSLQLLLNRSIDLIEAQAIRNPYFKEVVNKSKELVYGSGNESMAF